VPFKKIDGFTLVELLAAVSVVAILTTIALPNYTNQMKKTELKSCASTLAMVQTSTMLFNDEFSTPPRHWADLNSMSPLLTINGTAKEATDFKKPIELRDKIYRLTGNYISPTYTYICEPISSQRASYNAIGCVNIDTGASDIVLGRKDEPATSVNCN
jgi:type IV pilus assembly protein PilA